MNFSRTAIQYAIFSQFRVFMYNAICQKDREKLHLCLLRFTVGPWGCISRQDGRKFLLPLPECQTTALLKASNRYKRVMRWSTTLIPIVLPVCLRSRFSHERARWKDENGDKISTKTRAQKRTRKNLIPVRRWTRRGREAPQKVCLVQRSDLRGGTQGPVLPR